MGKYYRVTYTVKFTTTVNADEYDGSVEDAIANILIPEDSDSHYLVDSFEVIKSEPTNSPYRR
jgi:hypothetical protein